MIDTSHDNPKVAALKDALLTAAITFLMLAPITGIVLKGYAFNVNFSFALYATLAVFLGRLALLMLALNPTGQRFLDKINPANRSGEGVIVSKPGAMKYWYFILPLLFIAGAALPFFLGKYWLTNVILALIYVLLGLGLNIVVGLAGLLDLGFVAFYAVGAYLFALGSQYWGIGFWMALPLAAACAALAGGLLGFPVLRMHGDYLAIVTLGFGEIIRLILNNWMSVTGGPNGVSAPLPTFFGLEFGRTAKDGGKTFYEFFGLNYIPEARYIFIYLILFLVVCGMIYFVSRLRSMPMGRAWEALREDEIACRSLGINHVTVKLTAFMMGAMTGGIGGVFFATYQGFVNPTSFTFFESALILAIVVLGGMGSIVGVVLAALVLTLLPEVLREFSDYRVLVFGILMVVMMIWKPRGLMRIRRPSFAVGDKT